VGLKEIPLRIPLSISEPVLSGPDAMSGAVPAQAEKKG
jgi:ubiquinol-cytochrome c reductase cytochrome b subunit